MGGLWAQRLGRENEPLAVACVPGNGAERSRGTARGSEEDFRTAIHSAGRT